MQQSSEKASQLPSLTVGAGGVEALVAQPLGGTVGVELVLAGQAQNLLRVEGAA